LSGGKEPSSLANVPQDRNQVQTTSGTAKGPVSYFAGLRSIPRQPVYRSIGVELPDGTLYKTVLDFATLTHVGALLQYVCEKVGLKPYENYNIYETSVEDKIIDQLVNNEANTYMLQYRYKMNPSYKIAIKLKPGCAATSTASTEEDSAATSPVSSSSSVTSGPRRIPFVSASRTGKTPVSPTANNGNSALTAASPETSVVSPPSQVTVKRRKSFQEGLAYLANFAKNTIISSSNNLAAAGAKNSPSEASSKQNQNVHLTAVESIERRHLQNYLPEVIATLFQNTECTLNFSKLAERGRFMSWSKSSRSLAEPQASKVFGTPYQSVVEAEYTKNPDAKIPEFMTTCLEFIDKHGVVTPGIFRISGVSRKVQTLKKEIDSGNYIELSKKDYKPHDVTSLVKLFLRELPDPLMTHKLYEYYIAAAKYLEGEKLDEALKYLSVYLPISNVYLLEALLKLLQKISQFSGPASASVPILSMTKSDTEETLIDPEPDNVDGSEKPLPPLPQSSSTEEFKGNLMTISNLAIVVAPNLLRDKNERAEKSLSVRHYDTMLNFRIMNSLQKFWKG
jgi:hypothetical protein